MLAYMWPLQSGLPHQAVGNFTKHRSGPRAIYFDSFLSLLDPFFHFSLSPKNDIIVKHLQPPFSGLTLLMPGRVIYKQPVFQDGSFSDNPV